MQQIRLVPGRPDVRRIGRLHVTLASANLLRAIEKVVSLPRNKRAKALKALPR
jgi:hypothetical protein